MPRGRARIPDYNAVHLPLHLVVSRSCGCGRLLCQRRGSVDIRIPHVRDGEPYLPCPLHRRVEERGEGSGLLFRAANQPDADLWRPIRRLGA
jgi:hypothetical protein